MKIIFLDVDGVLNCAGSTSRAPGGCVGVDDDKVERLRKIVEATGAKIVLTSTWKTFWDKDPSLMEPDGEYLAKKLSRKGIKIRDKTEDHVIDRGHGILNYLAKFTEEPQWIVLDDDIFRDYQECGVMPHLVKTWWHGGGLTDDHVKQAIDLLMGA